MNYLLWQGFAKSALRHPDRDAVHDGTQTITYAALEAASRQFAGMLASWGIGRGDRVAMWLPKSINSIVCMLGSSRVGAAYVPVDPGAPALRAGVIVDDAQAAVLVTTSRLLTSLIASDTALTHLRRIVVTDGDDPAAPAPTWDMRRLGEADPMRHEAAAIESDPAYILYTSGSTGTPKGVVISHRNAITFIEWGRELCGVTQDDRLSSHAPLHFDLSVFDIYAALYSGACVFLIPDRVAPFAGELAAWIDRHQITIWYSVPSALIRLQRHGQLERFSFSSVRFVLFAGEVFPVKHLIDVMNTFGAARFCNWYGPTETNVCTYHHVPRPLSEQDGDLPIGSSCANYECFAVRDDGRLAEAGEEGELLVRGPGVMLGYWGLPERTAQSLMQNPLHTRFSDPVYHTGDVVRVREDGSFMFVGRRDHMVKTRGYRVELGEIEYVLHQHERVSSAVVVAIPDEHIGLRLWAAIVTNGDIDSSELAAFCRERLPHYAVPERFCVLRELPLTSTGKVDRQTLQTSMMATFNSQVA